MPLLLLFLTLLATPAMADEIRIKGSTTIAPMMRELIVAYQARYPNQHFSLSSIGSGNGIGNLIEGKADIAMLSRRMHSRENKRSQQEGVTIRRHVIALDGLVPIVHSSNTVRNLGIRQLRDIYLNEVVHWQEVGGPNLPITAYSREAPSGSFDTWREAVLEMDEEGLNNTYVASNQEMVLAVSRDRNGIGYVGMGFVTEAVRAVPITGAKATMKTIRNGKYPVTRTLNLYTIEPSPAEVVRFMDFISGNEGQRIVQKAGFVPIRKIDLGEE